MSPRPASPGPRRSRTRAALLPGLVLLLFATPSRAVVTATWSVESYKDFDAGDATDAFITSLGEVRPGWQTKKRVALDGDGVWSALRLSSGTVVVGTDAEGALFRVDGDKVKKVGAVPGAIAVVALAEAGGSVYAGAMPSDQIWKLDLASGKLSARVKLDPRTKDKDDRPETVWALAAGKDGTLWAGTGPDGRLWRIDRNGKARAVWKTDDKRVTAITVTSDGAVWFGTSERALVLRHDPRSGKTRAMADFAGNDIGAIAEVAGGVVVAANDVADAPAGPSKPAAQVKAKAKPNQANTATGQPAKMPDAGSKPGADKDGPAPERKGLRKGKGALFRVETSGRLEQLHALTQTYFTSIAVDPRGAIFAGAADKGRIYLVEPDDSVATAFDVDERAVAQVFWDGSQLAFTTDDTAALYRVTGKASAAKYVSDVFDAKSPSRWGRILWQGQGKLAVETRSGNTAKPDEAWSEWAKPSKVSAAGGGVTGGAVTSPVGRYFQFRVALPDDGVVRRVTTYYLPQNSATSIEEITIEPAQTEKQPTLKEAGGKTRSPILKLKWKVENPDSDQTSYVLAVRRDGDADWRELRTGKTPFTATSFDWNTETFPDGWYRLRVTSSDLQANSPDRALEAQRTSPLFAVDNTRPNIDGLTVRGGQAQARAADELNVITEMAFSVDDGPWQLGTTADGLFDDQSESLRVDLPADLKKGTHTLSLRVADAAGNVGSVTTTFVVR